MLRWVVLLTCLVALTGSGCTSTGNLAQRPVSEPAVAVAQGHGTAPGPIGRRPPQRPLVATEAPSARPGVSPQPPAVARPRQSPVLPASFEATTLPGLEPAGAESSAESDQGAMALETPPAVPGTASADGPAVLALDTVIASIYGSFPLLEAALRERDIADGQRVAAAGEFDLKIKGSSENHPIGYYETYRQNFGFVQPLYNGGEAFAGYRLGRGTFEPWYLNRQTNGGGEFKVGASIPLSRNRKIDERRAQLWNSTWDRKLVEPEIQAQLIEFVRDGSYTYWEWVAAGRRYRIAERLLNYALERDTAIRRKVEEGDTEEPVLMDNRRLIVSREAKLIDVRRKLQQSAIKLSLFYRAPDGTPVIPEPEALPDFPDEPPVDPQQLDVDIEQAIGRRPELRLIDLTRRQLEVDYAQAHNEFRPEIDGYFLTSKDVGAETSFQGYKTPTEVESGVLVEVPIQRRKARGKLAAVNAKILQLSAKRRIASDKITIEVQAAYTALVAALERVTRARESVELAVRLAAIERRKQELGEVDLLSVNLRELQAAEAADVEVDALVDYFLARADYRAALALDALPEQSP